MIESKLRNQYQVLVIQPILKRRWIQYLSPKSLTLAGLFMGLLIPVFLPLGFPLLSLFCLIVSGVLDTLDGSLARHMDRTSKQGAIIDITSDRIVEFAVVFGLFLVAPPERGLPCILMIGSILICITTFLGVGIFTQNQSEKGFYYSPGLIERAEAFIFFGAMIVFPSLFAPLAYLFSTLVACTAFIRIKQYMNLS